MLLCLAVLSAYSFYSTGLTLRLFPLFCLLPLFDLSCRRSSADNTGGGSGGPGLPGNFLTNHIASVTCCILASQLAPLCVHCGETAPVWLHCGRVVIAQYVQFGELDVRRCVRGDAQICVIMGPVCLCACLPVGVHD